MTDWTPSTTYAPEDIITAPALVESNFTWPELLTKAATLVLIIVAAIVVGHRIVIFSPLADGRQVAAAIGLVGAAMLFDFGASQILDWRRKRRALVLPRGSKVEAEYSSLQDAIDAGWIDSTRELQRHLNGGLYVMLRHPNLTVDAGTLRLLSRRPKPVGTRRAAGGGYSDAGRSVHPGQTRSPPPASRRSTLTASLRWWPASPVLAISRCR